MQSKNAHLGDSTRQPCQAQVVASLLVQLLVFRELNKAELYSMRINPVAYTTTSVLIRMSFPPREALTRMHFFWQLPTGLQIPMRLVRHASLGKLYSSPPCLLGVLRDQGALLTPNPVCTERLAHGLHEPDTSISPPCPPYIQLCIRL